jgi:hypothetical protein
LACKTIPPAAVFLRILLCQPLPWRPASVQHQEKWDAEFWKVFLDEGSSQPAVNGVFAK